MKFIFTLLILFTFSEVNAAAAAAASSGVGDEIAASGGKKTTPLSAKLMHLTATFASPAEAKVLYGTVGERRKEIMLIEFLNHSEAERAKYFTVIDFNEKSFNLPIKFSFVEKGRAPIMVRNLRPALIRYWEVITQAEYIEIDLRDETLDALQEAYDAGRLRNLKAVKIIKSMAPKIENLSRFLKNPLCSQLIFLDLSGNHIRAEGATAIAKSPHLTRLTTLNLSGGGIGDAGATAIAESSYLTRLTTLDLSWNGIGDAGATAIAKSPHLTRLTTLNLNFNDIGDEGAAAVEKSTHLPRLTTLRLT